MQADKIAPIECDYGAVVARRRLQYRGVRNALPRQAEVLCSDYVVTRKAQVLHYRKGKVLVREQSCQSRDLLSVNLSLDFGPMSRNVSPGVMQIVGTQRRVHFEQLCVRRSLASQLLQEPYWDTGTHNARIPPADLWMRLDTGDVIVQLADDNLEHVCLLLGRHFADEFVYFSNWIHLEFPCDLTISRGASIPYLDLPETRPYRVSLSGGIRVEGALGCAFRAVRWESE